MNEGEFSAALKKRGKEAHVIAELVEQVKRFEQFCAEERGVSLEVASEENIVDYARRLEERKTGAAKNALRGIALYYRFTGCEALAAAASGLREQAIARTRKSLPLREFLDADPAQVAALQAVGIADAGQLLAAGKTPLDRQRLAERTGLSIGAVLQWVKLADLSRLEGVKGIRARLYYAAGVDCVEKLAGWETEALLRWMADFVKRVGFTGIAPLPKEVRSTIQTAQKLPKIVEW